MSGLPIQPSTVISEEIKTSNVKKGFSVPENRTLTMALLNAESEAALSFAYVVICLINS